MHKKTFMVFFCVFILPSSHLFPKQMNRSARLRPQSRGAAGLRLRLAGKNFPPQTPPIFARSPIKTEFNNFYLALFFAMMNMLGSRLANDMLF
jgi:hypothetical protein